MDVIANGVNTRPITTDHEPYMTSVHVLLDFLSRLLPVASHHPLVTRGCAQPTMECDAPADTR